MKLQVSDHEQLVINRIEAGDVADFSGQTAGKPRIRASVLRAVALEKNLPCGLRIRQAHIDGDLDLASATLSTVAIEDCDIPGKIDLSNTRLGALSIDRSRFYHLLMRGAAIDGPFDFSDSSPFDSAAWIDISKARIRGGIMGFRARLKTPPNRPREQVRAWDHTYAIRLSESRIDGNLWLADGFVAEGGVCLDEAHVTGSLSLSNGARITASESDALHPGDALHAYAFRCDGMCGMNFGLQSEGRIFIAFSKFGSRIHIDGSFRKGAVNYDFKERRLNSSAALMIDDCEIGANVAFTAETTVDGSLSLSRSKIGGNVSFAGNNFGDLTKVRTAIFNKADDGRSPALVMDQSEIHRDLLFGNKFAAQGRVSIARMRIGGDADFTGARFDNATADKDGVALDVQHTQVAGEIRAGGNSPDFTKEINANGRVEVSGMKVSTRI